MNPQEYFKRGLAAAFPPPSLVNCSPVYKQMDLSYSNLKQVEQLRASNADGLGTGQPMLRIKALQDHLQEHQYVLIEKSGKWPGEYVPRSEERLYWLTGFSGSAGACLIGKHHAILFVDGRYPNQARREASHMQIISIEEQTMLDWLKNHTNADHALIFDGYSMPVLTYESFQKHLNLTLINQSPFILDSLWDGRFDDPKGPIWLHEQQYAGVSTHDKIHYYRQALKENNLDGFVITAPENIAWLLNIRGCDIETTPIPLTFATIWRDGKIHWYVDKQRLMPEVIKQLDSMVTIYPYGDFFDPDGSFNHQDKNMGFDEKTTTISIRKRLNTQAINLQDPCLIPKACKNIVEQEGMRKAHILDGIFMAKFICWLSKEALSQKITEMEASEYLNNLRLKQKECVSVSFNTISASGENAALPHYHPSASAPVIIDPKQVYLVDSGGQYFYGTTDLTRTIKLTPASEEEKKAYTLVLKGFIDLMCEQFTEATTAYELDDIARCPLNLEGMDYQHGTGHGVGSYLGVHEGPIAIANREASKQPLQEGMVMSIEPGYYQEGDFGFRVENLVIVQKNEQRLYFENLTYCPIDTNLIDTDLLEAEQIKWLNDYHQLVWDVIAPKLNNDKETQTWLKQACMPI